MARKFCPLSFFSFYVNKENAQAGGAHHCVEEECALWDETYEQCGLKTAVDSVSVIAETGPAVRKPRKEKLAEAASTRVTSLFDKLRGKKKLPTAGTPGAAPVVTTDTVTAVAQTPAGAAPQTNVANTATKVESDTKLKEQKNVETTVAVKEQAEKNSENNQLTLPIVKKVDKVPNPAVSLPPTSVETKHESKVESKAEPKPEVTQDDFSDLLNPPSIPISELPIISKPVDDDEVIEPKPKPLPVDEIKPELPTPTPVVEVKPEPPTPVVEVKPEPPVKKPSWDDLPDDLPLPEEFLETPNKEREEK